jgi:hypothetical protein
MSEHAGLLTRYQHLRQVGLRLNNRLVKTLAKRDLDEGGKKLGILKGNVLTLDSEDEIAVLMDYCLYDVRRQGVNAVERFLAKSPPPPDSDEMVLLQAMRQARFTLIAAESAERGVGVHVRDLLRDEPLFVVDVGFSRSISPDMVLAARLMAPEGMVMTTGAALPVGVLPPPERGRYLWGLAAKVKGADPRNLSPAQASQFTAVVLRACLEEGAAAHIEYVDPGRGRGPARRGRRNAP